MIPQFKNIISKPPNNFSQQEHSIAHTPDIMNITEV